MDRNLPASPLYILLHSWHPGRIDRRFLSDVTINIAIYIPLGMSAYLAFRRYRNRLLEIFCPVLLGTLLSAGVEMLQLFTPHRTCSAIDLFDNMIGSAAGVAAGFVFAQVTEIPAVLPEKYRARDRSAVALLLCWLCSLLFPFFPVLWLVIWRAKVAAFLHAPLVSPVWILLNASEWFAAGRLLRAAGFRSPRKWLLCMLILVPLQFEIVSHDPMPADFIGAAAGVVLFFLFGARKGVDRIAAAVLLLAVALRGLAPFRFDSHAHAFVWIPFGAFLAIDWQSGIQVLLRKLFEYGAPIALLHRAGMKTLQGAFAVVVVLAGIEAVQTYLPQHVAEVTDPLLALLLGLVFSVLSRRETRAPVKTPPELVRSA